MERSIRRRPSPNATTTSDHADPARRAGQRTRYGRIIDLIDSEITTAGMGVDSIVDRLADVLFVQALRAWCNSEQGTGIGWVAALEEARPLAATMGAMHSDLAHPWTVAELAASCGDVADHLRGALQGRHGRQSARLPLTCWRVYRRKRRPTDTDLPLTEIAVRVGYDKTTQRSAAHFAASNRSLPAHGAGRIGPDPEQLAWHRLENPRA